MIITTTWPDKGLLPISESIYKELTHQLTEGFDSEDAARQYWLDIATVLIYLSADDDLALIHEAPDDTQHQIQFVLSYPEFVAPIGEDYQLALAVFSDEGSGIYLLIHNDCSLRQELADV